MSKRFFDIIVSFVLLIIFSPVILIISLLLFWNCSGQVFFVQPRTGKDGVIFNLIKFKTMSDSFGLDGTPLSDEDRLTPIGASLRKTSLDELPQLLNVLKGEMSLVGPRPLLPEYLPVYSLEQNKRHMVLPGITGLAQIKGRNNINWITKFKYDVWYVKHKNFYLDLKIMILTIKPIVKRENINFQNNIGSEKFTGQELQS